MHPLTDPLKSHPMKYHLNSAPLKWPLKCHPWKYRSKSDPLNIQSSNPNCPPIRSGHFRPLQRCCLCCCLLVWHCCCCCSLSLQLSALETCLARTNFFFLDRPPPPPTPPTPPPLFPPAPPPPPPPPAGMAAAVSRTAGRKKKDKADEGCCLLLCGLFSLFSSLAPKSSSSWSFLSLSWKKFGTCIGTKREEKKGFLYKSQSSVWGTEDGEMRRAGVEIGCCC